MILSRKSDYGLRAALELAQLHGGFLSARQIAQTHGLPAAFVKKLMQILCRAGLVTATVGQQGGYRLARPPDQISIRKLLEALEGDLSPVACLIPDADCELVAGCPTRRVWSQIDRKIQQALQEISLQDALEWSREGEARDGI
jgi:Rrf2 family protein